MQQGEPVSGGGGGPVELREDVPLKAGWGGAEGGGGGAGGARCSGPRFIVACFAALSAGITLALLAQIYHGEYGEGLHGAAAASAAECSGAGAAALRRGGGALDAAVAAALCLVVLQPQRASLDSSGALLMWEYRKSRSQPPSAAEWGGVGDAARAWPRLPCALATLHAAEGGGRAPWRDLLQPALDLARNGFTVSSELASTAAGLGARAGAGAGAAWGGAAAGTTLRRPELADTLQSLQNYTSAELSLLCDGAALVQRGAAEGGTGLEAAGAGGAWAGGAWAGGAGARPLLRALGAAAAPAPLAEDLDPVDAAIYRAVSSLAAEAGAAGAAGAGGAGWAPRGVASGLAVVDSQDVYVSLVIGLSTWFGSGAGGAGGGVDAAPAAAWPRDEPAAPLDLTPVILFDEHVCGARYILGSSSTAAAAGAGAALRLQAGAPAAAALRAALERPRLELRSGPGVAAAGWRAAGEAAPRGPAAALAARLGGAGPAAGAPAPPAPVNAVSQRGDELTSHADSRGGARALASRF